MSVSLMDIRLLGTLALSTRGQMRAKQHQHLYVNTTRERHQEVTFNHFDYLCRLTKSSSVQVHLVAFQNLVSGSRLKAALQA